MGRSEELARLEEEASRAAGGELRVVLLVGEAGVGKSRLARELLARSDASIGLLARAHALAATAPLGLWTEAVDPFLQLRSDAEVVDLCGGVLDDLASLFFRVAAVRGSVPERDPPLPRLMQGLAHLLRSLSQQAPLVVVLDDAHFGDASSWESLRFLARHLDDARLLVVGTARPADLADHELAAQVLFELDQDGFLVRLELAPLARGDLRQLSEAVIDAPAPAALVDWVAERSQGNPLYAIGLLRALLVEQADLSAPSLQRLPEGLTERVISELRQFDPTARSLLELLAVVARPVSLDDLCALADVPLEALEGILDGLVRARVVVEDGRGGVLTYDLHHPLIRDVIYGATSRGRRRALHRCVGRSLRASGHLAEAALHFARAAERGDSEAVEVVLDAMRQAERREAFREALALQAELVELLPGTDRRWLEVLEAMYWRAEWLIDHRAETHASVSVRALRMIDALLAESSDYARRATVKFRLANFLAWGTGELEAAEAACRQAQELFARVGDEHQMLLAAREVSWIKGLRGDLSGMARDAAEVVQAAEARGDRFVAMQGLAAQGYCATFRGALAEGEAALARAAMIAREDEKAYRLTVVLGVLASNLALQGRVGQAAVLFTEARSRNPAHRESILVELETLVAWIGGDFTAAAALVDEAIAWTPGATARRRAFGLAFGAQAAVEVGDLHLAERLLARGHGVLGDREWQFFPPLLQWGDAVLAWNARRPGDAVAILRPAVARLLAIEARSWCAFLLLDLAESAADAGDVGAAREAAAGLLAISEFTRLPLYRGYAALGAGCACMVEGRAEHAVVQAREAARLLSGPECPAVLARAHDLLGRSLAGEERAQAAVALERAAAMFERCGSKWRRGRSLEALRRLGSAGRRAAAAALGAGSLTRREREVAKLAATGISAKEIGQTLFVGERTVESHLANIYAKLGVESKLELVRRADELGLS